MLTDLLYAIALKNADSWNILTLCNALYLSHASLVDEYTCCGWLVQSQRFNSPEAARRVCDIASHISWKNSVLDADPLFWRYMICELERVI
jgi:hypothetical protein